MESDYATALIPEAYQKGTRLLTIHAAYSTTDNLACSLEAYDIEAHTRSYEALSYTWGPEFPRFQITINNATFMVRRSFFYTLRRLRRSEDLRVVWNDAVCTNQKDLGERARSVDFMGEIYSSAKAGVVVWFGEENPGTPLVASYLNRLISGFERLETKKKWVAKFTRKRPGNFYGVPPLDDPGWVVLYNLLLTPWSSRVWVVQEVATAHREPEVRILRGGHVFSMQKIALAMSIIYKYRLERELRLTYPARFATLWGERIWRKDNPKLLDVVARQWLTYATDLWTKSMDWRDWPKTSKFLSMMKRKLQMKFSLILRVV